MKRIALLILSAMTMMVAFSCTKELNGAVDKAEGTVSFSVRAELPDYDEATKSTLVNTVRVKWETGDKIYVYDDNSCLGYLEATVTDGEGKVAYLSGEIKESAASMLTLVSMTNDITPSVIEKGSLISGGITFDLSEQNFDGAPYVAYATVSNNITSGITASFTFATAVESVFCTGLKGNAKVDNVTIQGVNTQLTIKPASSGAPEVNATNVGEISMNITTSVQANADGVMAFSVALLAQGASDRQINVTQDDTSYKAKFTAGGALNVGTSYSTVTQLNRIPDDALKGEFSVNATKKVQFSKGNLWADNSNVLHFEDEQYNFSIATNGNIDPSHVSYFTWSSTVQSAVSSNNSGTFLFCDVDHKQSVEGSEPIYYALSSTEWYYLLNTRNVNGGGSGDGKAYSLNITYGNNVGMVIYPDNYSGAILSGTVQTLPEGVVFLPLAGNASNSVVNNNPVNGSYWCSDTYGGGARYLYQTGLNFPVVGGSNALLKNQQLCIRLVKDVKE